MIIGNKKDLKSQRTVNKEKVLEFCKLYSMTYYETSALSAEKVEEAFSCLTENCIKNDCFVTEEDEP